MKKSLQFTKILVLSVLTVFFFASCASAKISSQAKTPNTVDADSTVVVQEAK